MSNLISAMQQDFRAYSEAHDGSLQRAIGPFLNLGYYVVTSYRVRAGMRRFGPIGRFISIALGLLSNIAFGCYISSKARIGGGLYMPHPIGIVIGDGVTLGTNVRVYQNVTLGSRAKGAGAYPTVGDGALIFPNAVIVGQIKIGTAATIGAGSVVLSDVPSNHTAVGNPARILTKSL